MTEYYRIKDNCRAGLLQYLAKAISMIPVIDNPVMLDIGCGTGVPTLWVAEKLSGSFLAVDIDNNALDWLKKKARNRNLEERITTLNRSYSDYIAEPGSFDLILAEGFLNNIGFEIGFPLLIKLLKRKKYLIVHDEFREHENKIIFMQNNKCRIIDSFSLDEKTWWNDYYQQLETEINKKENISIKHLFDSELKEIANFKEDPSLFKSVYYIIEKL